MPAVETHITNPPRPPWVRALIAGSLAAIVLILLFALSPNFRWTPGPEAAPYAGDYLQEWIGGRLLAEGQDARFYEPRVAQAYEHDPTLVGYAWHDDRWLPMVYPPVYYALVAPLSTLPFVAAAWLFALLMTAALAASLPMLGHALGATRAIARWPAGPWEVLPPLAVLFPPVLESLASCQKGTLWLLLLTGVCLFDLGRRRLAAGLLLGVLAIKPPLYVGVLAVTAATGRWRLVAGAIFTGSLFVAASFWLSPEMCRSYLAFAGESSRFLESNGYDLAKSHCLYGAFTALFGPERIGLAQLATVVTTVATLAHLAWSGQRGKRPRQGVQLAILILAALAISPHLFTYDLTILLLPMALLLREACRATDPRPFLAAVGVLYGTPTASVAAASLLGWPLSPFVLLGVAWGLERFGRAQKLSEVRHDNFASATA